MKKFLIPLICLLAAACSSVPVSKSSEYLAKGEMYYKTGRVQKLLNILTKPLPKIPITRKRIFPAGLCFIPQGSMTRR